ncbi:MAG: hypothetical protein QXO75_10795 [Nitrososphaerota archaeon]
MRERQYGKRWRVEIFFSALKSVMGEIIMTKKLKYQIMEYWMKICIINEKEYAGESNANTLPKCMSVPTKSKNTTVAVSVQYFLYIFLAFSSDPDSFRYLPPFVRGKFKRCS